MKKAKIALLGAMGEETHLLQKAIEGVEVVKLADRDFYVGHLGRLPVVTSFSKWGKVAAAISTTLAIEYFGVDEVLFLGVAGSFDDRVKQGDVVIGSQCLQYDMDVSALPDYSNRMIPLLKVERFNSPAQTVELLRELAVSHLAATGRSGFGPIPNVHVGLLGTGDCFIADSVRKQELKRELPDLLAVDMESAAAAQVCYEFKRPFNVIRIISDGADDDAVLDFQRFVEVHAAPAVKQMALGYVKILADRWSGD